MERFPEFIANNLFLFSLLIAILSLLSWNLFGHMLSSLKVLPHDEITRLINREDAGVVDLRTRQEFESGHIVGSLNIDAEQLASQLDKLNHYKDKGIILCCARGNISPREARKLINQGYEKVYCLKGGISSWQNASLPLTKEVK